MAGMAQPFQFRLRALFYVTTVAAVLCLMLPPIFRAVQRHLASQRRPPVQLPIDVTVEWPNSEIETTLTETTSDYPIPTDAAFIQTTIIRVNGKRIDSAGDTNTEMTEAESDPVR